MLLRVGCPAYGRIPLNLKARQLREFALSGEAIRPVVPVVSKPAHPNVNCSIIVMLKIDRSGGERVPVASRYSLSRSDSYRNIGSEVFAITVRTGYCAIAVQGDSY